MKTYVIRQREWKNASWHETSSWPTLKEAVEMKAEYEKNHGQSLEFSIIERTITDVEVDDGVRYGVEWLQGDAKWMLVSSGHKTQDEAQEELLGRSWAHFNPVSGYRIVKITPL